MNRPTVRWRKGVELVFTGRGLMWFTWTDHGPMVAVWRERHGVFRVGWGFDSNVPLSCAPQMFRADEHDLCVAWFGFYLGTTIDLGEDIEE